jgi:hypothetical protein
MNCIINDKKKLPLDYNTAMNKEEIFKISNPYEGEVAYANDTNETYLYKDNKWEAMPNKVKIEGEGLKMNLYDLNCSIIDQLPSLEDFTDAEVTIEQYKTLTGNEYYMLYGKDISYFTLFRIFPDGEFDALGQAVIECLSNVGEIKSIDLTENKDAIEIWVKTNEQVTCLYLFAYDNGVVTVKED